LSTRPRPALLCVCNYPSNTGYAWDFIESLYAEIARRLEPHGLRTLVAYPQIDQSPRTLAGSPAVPIALDARLTSWQSLRATAAVAGRENVVVAYFTDHPAWSSSYALLRLAGVRSIIVHDHSSGQRSVPRGIRRAVKWVIGRSPGIVADVVVAVSDFVARRQMETGLIPASRVVRVWNGTVVPSLPDVDDRPLHRALHLAVERPAIVCACRAAAEKGVPVLLKSFDLLLRRWSPARPRPILVYMGDGPQFAEIQQVRAELDAKEDIVLAGYRRDAPALIAGADICAMPSLWQDALPLAVMQPMALGRPVVASAVGGIPEMIVQGETGLLVPPHDEPALAAALEQLLLDPSLRLRLGQAARRRVANLFTPAQQVDALTSLVLRGFGLAAEMGSRRTA
jgi:glycosyltransferase involved in cell wall biosynthesis